MSEEQPASRHGFLSRMFSGHDPRVAAQRKPCYAPAKMITVRLPIFQRNPISRGNFRGRSPP